jgi:hypothetical protein
MYQASVQSILLYGEETRKPHYNRLTNYLQLRWIFGEDTPENQGNKNDHGGRKEHFTSNCRKTARWFGHVKNARKKNCHRKF